MMAEATDHDSRRATRETTSARRAASTSAKRAASTADAAEDDALYAVRINHPSLDTRARLFRECEAMAEHMASNGLDPSDTVVSKIGLLDVGITRRSLIPMSELVLLHHALAETIEPAKPGTVELLAWDAREARLNWLAPIAPMRRLMYFSAFFWALFLITALSGQLSAETVGARLFALSGYGFWTVAMVLAFYLSLAGIGATFAVLYDARGFIAKGTFDPRLGSDYPARIALGLMSGLLLAQLLSEPDAAAGGDEETSPVSQLATFGKPLLALLGGFAAQFVYRALKKLVDALDSVFRPERSAEMALAEREIRLKAREREATAGALRAGEALDIAGQLREAKTDEARAVLAERLIRNIGGEALERAGVGAAGAIAPAHEALARVDTVVTMGRAALDLFPDALSKGDRAALERIGDRVGDARRIAERGASGDLVGMTAELAGELLDVDPVRKAVRSALSAFGGPLSAALGVSVAPGGLALAALGVGVSLGRREYARWKARVLDAPYSPDLLEIDTVDAAAVKSGLDRAPALAEAFADRADSPSALNDLGRELLSRDAAALFAAHGRRFDGDEAAFDAALDAFRKAILGRAVMAEFPDEAIADSGARDRAELLAAFDAARGNPAAAAELDRLSLLAAAARDPENPVDPARVRDLILEETEAVE